LYVPGRQDEQLVKAAALVYDPESQMLQFMASVVLEKDPALHVAHAHGATYTPPGLHMHRVDAMLLVYEVLAHAVHEVDVELE
jgi:hypothetical protein